MRLVPLVFLLVVGCRDDVPPDRKPGNAPGAPKQEAVLHDARDPSVVIESDAGVPGDAGLRDGGVGAGGGAR